MISSEYYHVLINLMRNSFLAPFEYNWTLLRRYEYLEQDQFISRSKLVLRKSITCVIHGGETFSLEAMLARSNDFLIYVEKWLPSFMDILIFYLPQ